MQPKKRIKKMAFQAKFVVNNYNGYSNLETDIQEVYGNETGVVTNRKLEITGTFRTRKEAEILIDTLLKRHLGESEQVTKVTKNEIKRFNEYKKEKIVKVFHRRKLQLILLEPCKSHRCRDSF